jgi:uncharacterized membrane-anchored protein
MKHLKKIISVIILGFLAFAPPGTLILTAIFIMGLFGKAWLIFGIITGLILLIVYGFVYRDKIANNNCLKAFWQKFKK